MSLFGHSVSRIYFLFLGTLTRSGGLLLGAALAIWWRPWLLKRSQAGSDGSLFDLVGLVGLGVIVFAMFKFHTVVEGTDAGTIGYDFLFRGGFFIVDLASVALIAAAVHPSSYIVSRSLGNPVFVWLGRRSYGFYLFHWPVFQFYRRFAGIGLTPYEFVVLVLIALVFTELSFRLIETPVRHGAISQWWKKFRAPSYGSDAVTRQRQILFVAVFSLLPVFGVVSLVTAKVQVDEITQNLTDNQQNIVDLLDSGATAAPVVVSGTTILGQPPADPGSLDGRVIDILAIGDSVMLGAANVLTERGVTVDALKSRPFRQALEIANYMKSINRLGSVVIIHLGTNNTVDAQTLDEIMVPLKEVPLVLFVNVHVPAEARQNKNNLLLSEMPSRYENVKVFDWNAVANAHPEYLYNDQTHIRIEGQKVYADLMMQAIGRP